MKVVKSIFVFFMILIATSCTSNPITYKDIDAEEAYQMIENSTDIIILDVRTNEEYLEGHIENAINIPYDELEERFGDEVTTDKEKTILVYCQSGRRATEASQILANLEYANIYNFGGIIDWTYGIVTTN